QGLLIDGHERNGLRLGRRGTEAQPDEDRRRRGGLLDRPGHAHFFLLLPVVRAPLPVIAGKLRARSGLRRPCPRLGKPPTEARSISVTGNRSLIAGSSIPLIRAIRASTPRSPKLRIGCRTVVIGGSSRLAKGMSSKPASERSRGDDRPRSRKASRMPITR